jgi:CheY-like chemotaxis protein
MASTPRPGSLASRFDVTSTVLVVEDEADIATFLGAFFRASGTEVVHVNPSTPAEVVELAAARSAKCALVDLNLGGLTGFDILEAMRHDERVNLIPIVVLTADARSATRERAVELGAAAFVAKPFNVKDLFATVQTLVEGDPLLGEGESNHVSGAWLRRGALRGGLIPAEALHARLDEAVATAGRAGGTACFALIRVTGTTGHQAAVMTELATRLADALPHAEVLGASAPGELALVFPAEAAATAGKLVIDTLGSEAFNVTLPAGRVVSVAYAAGVASWPDHATTGDELYMAADAALAEAVDSGQPVTIAR